MYDLQDDRQKLLDDKDRLKAKVENLEIELDEALQSKRNLMAKTTTADTSELTLSSHIPTPGLPL